MKRLKQGAAALTGVLLLLSGCSGGVDEYQCVHPETGTLVQQLVEGTGTVSYREEYSVIPTVSARSSPVPSRRGTRLRPDRCSMCWTPALWRIRSPKPACP
ncbi:hypothetical protein [Flavonifractor plautii]|uniref:hypothetical protein n=1 Tax=Flavonifractor plautii TaxID=292800 RepID=UPI003A1DF585